MSKEQPIVRAVFGANCFWGGEAAFRKLDGVVETAVGFMGDSLCNCCVPKSDRHARDMNQVEVVVVDFDPDVISYKQLTEAFWTFHNPSHNPLRSEDSLPSPERSVIFVADDAQHKIAKEACVLALASKRFDAPITTTVEDVTHFHRASEDQQRYLERNEGAVCSLKNTSKVVAPQ